MKEYSKAISAALTAAVAFLAAVGIDVPQWATGDWIAAVSLAFAPIGVYFAANKPKAG